MKEIKRLKKLKLFTPQKKTEQYSGNANYTTTDIDTYLTTICWDGNYERSSRVISFTTGGIFANTWTYEQAPTALKTAGKNAVKNYLGQYSFIRQRQ